MHPFSKLVQKPNSETFDEWATWKTKKWKGPLAITFISLLPILGSSLRCYRSFNSPRSPFHFFANVRVRLTKSISLVCLLNSLFWLMMIRNATFSTFLAVWAINTYGLYRMIRGWEGATWRETYNWISSILVFDTIPILGFTAVILSVVGHKHEKLKFRIVGCAMIGVSVIVGLIFGPSIYIDPLTGIFSR